MKSSWEPNEKIWKMLTSLILESDKRRIFFLQYHWITHLGHKCYGNDPRLQQKTILIVKKISLSVLEEM